MTTIAIDCRFAGTGTGLARYTKELVRALLARSDGDLRYVLLVRKLSDLPDVVLPHRVLLADIPHYSLAEQTTLPKLLRGSGADIVFFPHFNAPFFCPLPSVVTVHDLILHRHPGDASFLKRAAYRILVHRSLRRARRIIAVSAWTKEDLRRTYGPRIAKKTTVIGNGVSDAYGATRKHPGFGKPYFLYVGNCKPHKNVPFLLEAFRAANLPDTELILVSGGEDARALTLPPNVRLLQDVSDDDLPALYAGARCFVTASLDEGYCLPVAEALACGCPVIATNRTAIPETVGNHGMLLEPTLEAYVAAFRAPPTLPAPVRVGSWHIAASATARLLAETLQ